MHRRTRKGNFRSHQQDEEYILKQIKLELGPGDWDIDYHISGIVINWTATRETKY